MRRLYIGGKRINFCSRGEHQRRTITAFIQHNKAGTSRSWSYLLKKSTTFTAFSKSRDKKKENAKITTPPRTRFPKDRPNDSYGYAPETFREIPKEMSADKKVKTAAKYQVKNSFLAELSNMIHFLAEGRILTANMIW